VTRVTVLCPRCNGNKIDFKDGSGCAYCWHIDQPEPSGTILATPSPETAALIADGEKALAFVREIFGGEYERGDWEGADLQNLGVKTGVLRVVSVDEPCGEACGCAGYGDFPMECYRLDVAAPRPAAGGGG